MSLIIGGMTPNALANRRYLSGGRGKDKFLQNRKVGRPGSVSRRTGININQDVKEQIRQALNKYYFNKQHGTDLFAYKMMLLDHYSEKIVNDMGKEELVIKEESPSYRQFTYWANKLFSPEQRIIKKEGKKKYEKDHRGTTGSSVYEVFGPGSRFEIDSTPANTYVVSAYDREKIIGKPTIYICVDVFSRLIVGFYVGIENVSSWSGAISTMVNTATNKKELCKRYGIEIEESEWPSAHFPRVLLADKGEFIGYNSDSLEKNFKITVENTSSYRADMKGTVEKLLDLVPRYIYHFAPGTIEKDFLQRGGKDYRLDAKLTLKEFSTLMIYCILHYNRSYLKNYPITKAMFEDGVKPIPIELWEWGINNCSGNLKSFKPDYVYYHLLPRGNAVVRQDGIYFKGARYTSVIAEEENWFSIARNKGRWKVSVCYDKRFSELIYLIVDNNIIPCVLLPHQERFLEVTFEDIEFIEKILKEEKSKEKSLQTEKDVNLYNTLSLKTKEFLKKADLESNQNTPKHKSQKIKNIKFNRELERKVETAKEISNIKKLQPEESSQKDTPQKVTYRKKSIIDLGLYKGEESNDSKNE